MKSSGINLLKLNLDWPSIKLNEQGTWPPTDPDWFKNQGLEGALGSVVGQMGAG